MIRSQPSVFWSWSGLLDFFGTATVGQSDGINTLDNAVGISFSLTDNAGIFLEYLGGFSEGDGPAHELHTGLTWLLAENLQVDINGGVGLNTRANDYFLGTGIGYRF